MMIFLALLSAAICDTLSIFGYFDSKIAYGVTVSPFGFRDRRYQLSTHVVLRIRNFVNVD